jgi:hypothetical protein
MRLTASQPAPGSKSPSLTSVTDRHFTFTRGRELFEERQKATAVVIQCLALIGHAPNFKKTAVKIMRLQFHALLISSPV